MKKNIIIALAALAALTGCSRTGDDMTSDGYLSFTGFNLMTDSDVVTKATAPADYNYSIFIYNANDELAVSTTYGKVITDGGKISLPAGSYRLEARSISTDVPAAEFERPVYGASKEFDIISGGVTEVGTLTCTLLQTKVTVSYNDDFLAMVTGNGNATVTVTSGYPLSYALDYNSGNPSYEQSAGYFAVNNGSNTTMEVTFKGSIAGKSQKMTKVFTGIETKTWHQIKFVKKEDTEGSASFIITIDDFVEDVELKNDIDGEEPIIGDDPNAPQGDGGIMLESTCSYDITQPVTVPAMGNPFVLTMKATVPNKVKKFTVEISSDNPAFTSSVGAINDGQTTLDLVNPSSGAQQVFTDILPFPYGSAVVDKDEIDFNLSDAQEPILAFAGTHTFTMHVTDQKGCKKDIQIVMVVE